MLNVVSKGGLMKYNINGKVVDPIHGAGVITEISDQMVSGEICECVVIEIVVGKKKVMVPTESLHDAELRPVVSSEELESALQELFEEPDELPKDWRRRIEKLKDRVHSGEPREVAKAIRDIIARSVLNKMNPSEKRVLNEAICVFAGEVALVRNIRSDSARDLIKRSAQQGVQQNIKSGDNVQKSAGAASDHENAESAEEVLESSNGSGAGKSRKKASGGK